MSSCSIGRSVDPPRVVDLSPLLAHMICVCSFMLAGDPRLKGVGSAKAGLLAIVRTGVFIGRSKGNH